jgi:hypothetical protein
VTEAPGSAVQPVSERATSGRRGEPRYNLIDHNCSTVIAVMMQLGSAIEPSFIPAVAIDDHASTWAQRLFLRMRFFSNSIKMWTPDDVLRYAKEIQAKKT